MRNTKLFLCVALLSALPGVAGESPAGRGEDPASNCRALINLTGTPVDPVTGREKTEAGTEHFVVDLRIAEKTGIEVGRGLMVRDGGETWALERVDHQRSDTGPDGTSMERAWNDLVAIRLPDGESAVWIDGEPELVFPDPDREHSYDETRWHSVIAVIGPYVSVETSSNGFLGGPHESTWVRFSTLRAGKRMSLDFLGPEATAAMVAAVAEETENRRARLGDSEEALVPPEDLADVALSFGEDGRLQLSTVLFCCSWYENRNMLYVDAPLFEVPPSLGPYLNLVETPESRMLIEAPDGCGAVGLARGVEGLAVRRGGSKDSVVMNLPGIRPVTLLGVYWIAAEDRFRVAQLNR